MSREERKMAQIIASIERMEQRKAPTPSSAASARADTSVDSDGNVSSSNSSSNSSRNATGTTGAGAVVGGSGPSTTERTAGLERMNSSEIHAQVQKSSARLGAKGRKLKPLATSSGVGKTKVKSGGGGKRAKTPKELVVDRMAIVDCKLTPKKRWIQLWTEQLSSSSDEAVDADVGASRSGANKDAEMSGVSKGDGERNGERSDERADSPPEASVEKSAREPEQEPSGASIDTDSQPLQSVDAPAPPASSPVATMSTPIANMVMTVTPEQSSRVRPTIALEEGEEEGEEGEELPSAESVQPDASLASPSPQTDDQKDTSISPVSSVKESLRDAAGALAPPKKKSEEREGNVVTPTVATTAAAPDAELHAATTRSVRPAAMTATAVTRADISGSADTDDTKRAVSARQPLGTGPLVRASPLADVGGHDRSSRKRSLERKDSEPLTEEEKRRAERRRQRKSNWDVGDPRFAARSGDKTGGPTPSGDDIASSSKFPTGRPAWRHSNSMDATHSSAKSSFANGPSGPHRSSFGGGSGGPPRRGFYSSNSLPLDRSRSAGRSSSTFHYPNSYR